MASPDDSRVRRFLNNAPFWQKYPIWVIFCCSLAMISKAFIYRFSNGGWDMDWATKFRESLFFGILFGLYAAWPTRKGVGKNEQDERQRR
jgi:hypothetical protein